MWEYREQFVVSICDELLAPRPPCGMRPPAPLCWYLLPAPRLTCVPDMGHDVHLCCRPRRHLVATSWPGQRPFAQLLAQYEALGVPTAVILEPDSLPNLVTNAQNPRCGAATRMAYSEGVAFASKSSASTRAPFGSTRAHNAHTIP